MGFCQRCAVEAPTMKVAFRQNVGVLVMRFHSTIDCEMCKACVNEEFGKKTLITVAVGWLGVVSLVIAPIFVLANIFNFVKALNLESVPSGKRGSNNDPAAIRRLALAIPVHARRFDGSEPLGRVYNDLCRDAQCTDGQARAFMAMVTEGRMPAPGPSLTA